MAAMGLSRLEAAAVTKHTPLRRHHRPRGAAHAPRAQRAVRRTRTSTTARDLVMRRAVNWRSLLLVRCALFLVSCSLFFFRLLQNIGCPKDKEFIWHEADIQTAADYCRLSLIHISEPTRPY